MAVDQTVVMKLPRRTHNWREKYGIGLDVGCTSIKGVAITHQGKVLARVALPTQDTGSTRWRLNIRRALEQLQTAVRSEPAWIGLGAPGLPGPERRCIDFMPGRLRGIEGLIWQDFLRAKCGVPVLNDAQAALLGEVWRGAARRARNALLLTLGTGVGGAALVDGRLLGGHIGRAGHLGHISLNPHGERDVANTPGSLEGAIGDCTIEGRSHGRFKTTGALVAAARAGDSEARRLWLESVRALAAGLVSLINVLDPEVVVLGGGIAKAGPALFRPLGRFLSEFEWRPGGARVMVRPARLGDWAGAFGAAWNSMKSNCLEIK